MEKLAPLIIVVIAFAVFIQLLRALTSRRSPESARDYEYSKRTVLSTPEQVLYHRLVQALPQHLVLAQVALSRVIKQRSPRDLAAFRAISQKSVDYVICNKAGATVTVIELDDKSHDADHRRQGDRTKDAALQSAGIKLIRWSVKNLPDAAAIQAAVLPSLVTPLAAIATKQHSGSDSPPA